MTPRRALRDTLLFAIPILAIAAFVYAYVTIDHAWQLQLASPKMLLALPVALYL